MIPTSRRRRAPLAVLAACAFVFTLVITARAQQPPPGQQPAGPQGRGQQGPPAPTGPLAPEKYKNILALTDIAADQVDVTMRYFVAATGIQCIQCHVQDASTGEWQYDKDDKNTKKTARKMIVMVKAINGGSADYGLNGVNCGTCHAGNNQPRGLQPAQMMTADQITAMLAQQAAMAARQGGAGRGDAGGAPGGQRGAGAPGAPPAAGGGGQGGRGPQVPAPPIDDVINKYIDGLGGRPAIEKLQAVLMTGTVTNRAAQTVAFTIEEKGAKYRESVESQPNAMIRAFDGTAGWAQTGAKVETLDAFPAQQVRRDNNLMLALTLKDRFPNLTAGRPANLTLTPGATPTAVNSLSSGPASGATNYTTETMYFDATTGLLLRKTVRTTTALRGSMTEQWDYSDFRVVGGVKMPFEIKHTNWNTVDTFKVADIKANPAIDDGRFAKPR